MSNNGNVYLIPTFLDEHALQVIPSYVIEAVKECNVFFVENERSARRFLKSVWKEIQINDYEWLTIHKVEEEVKNEFRKRLREGKNIGILSEAGCPGIADPGQLLVALAQEENARIKPLVGPSSILLSLMASGMNGQQFQFVGYLPIDQSDRVKKIKELETESQKRNCTQIFIETPYRNQQLMDTIIKTCKPQTKFCIAANLTAKDEIVKTKSIGEWKNNPLQLSKQPAIFLLYAGI